jgi:hypothetical protein
MLQLEQLVSSGRFLDLERGSDQYDCDRIHIETYRDLIQALDLIIHEKSRHEIIVVDPIEIAEKNDLTKAEKS